MTCCDRVKSPHSNILKLPSHFQEKYLIGSKKTRSRKFTPLNLLLTLSKLVSGTNNNGYTTAIYSGLLPLMDQVELPTKGALSQMRARVSFRFFKSLLFKTIQKAKRKTWKGLYVYAIDGLQLTLPRTDDIIAAGYHGRAVSEYRESYTPRMFFTHAYDVLNGTTKDFREGTKCDEARDARSMVKGFEDNCLVIYDRLYCSRELIHVHHDNHSYFLFRLRESVMKEMQIIFRSKRTRKTVVIDGIEVQLIKLQNPKTGEWIYFATNLPKNLVNDGTVSSIYRLRWEVENSFRDFTQTIKLEQWRSKSINGIRQELCVALWLYNFTKVKILSKFSPGQKQLETEYKKPNFKALFHFMSENLLSIIRGVRRAWRIFVELIYCTIERRKRYSRSYPRELKCPASPYPYNNTRWVV